MENSDKNPFRTTITGNDRQSSIHCRSTPTQIGAKGPKYLRNNGAIKRAVISRIILINRAIVPSSAATCIPREAPFNWVIRIEDRE